MRKCPICGAAKLVTRQVERRVRVGHYAFVTVMPERLCGSCGEGLVGYAQAKQLELAIAARLADLGATSGAAFKYMRKALGLRATALAELLDLTPETISRWETGRVAVDRRAVAALGALVRDAVAGSRATLDHLRALCHPPPAPHEIRLRLAAMAEAVAAYEAEFGVIPDKDLAAQARADRRSAIVVGGRARPRPRRRRA